MIDYKPQFDYVNLTRSSISGIFNFIPTMTNPLGKVTDKHKGFCLKKLFGIWYYLRTQIISAKKSIRPLTDAFFKIVKIITSHYV